MKSSRLPELSNYSLLYETEPDCEGIKRYFIYDIRTKELFELVENVYQDYRLQGAWTNLVPDERCLKYMLTLNREAAWNRIQIKEN